MAKGYPKKIQMEINEERYWEGLGRQEMDFHQVLGELIDNCISASGFDTDGDLLPFTIEITIQRISNKIKVKVADQGIGMSLNDLESYILSPGGKGSSTGPLNEHGFGLKNALCMLSLGNKFTFRIQTRDEKAVTQDRCHLVEGPFSSNMTINLDDSSNWNTNLKHAKAKRGTRIYAETSYGFFNTLYKRGKLFEDLLMTRLGEHLGVMYRGFLKSSSNKIWLRWQDLGTDEENPNTSSRWTEKRIPAIEIPYDVKGCTERIIGVSCSEGNAEVVYREGCLDKGKISDATQGWPYPLRIYYQGNIPTQGIDICKMGRVIKTGQLSEVWPERQRHNDYNQFAGELLLEEEFRTVNNKIALDPHSTFWQGLVDKLTEGDEYNPAKRAGKQTEKDIKDKLKIILEGAVAGSEAQLDRPVWSGSGVKIDIYHNKPKGTDIYEVKPDTAAPLDVYQLLMYWDGVVADESKSPELGRLVAKEAPNSVKNIIENLNTRKDAHNHPYNFEFKKITDFGIKES